MSDPVTNVEIEDVLSSIRRLVTEESQPGHRKLAREKPDSQDRLVLTPALRVADAPDTIEDEPAHTKLDAFVFQHHPRVVPSEPEPQEAVLPDVSQPTEVSDDVGEADASESASDDDMDYPDDVSDTADVTEREGSPWSDPGATLFEAAHQMAEISDGDDKSEDEDEGGSVQPVSLHAYRLEPDQQTDTSELQESGPDSDAVATDAEHAEPEPGFDVEGEQDEDMQSAAPGTAPALDIADETSETHDDWQAAPAVAVERPAEEATDTDLRVASLSAKIEALEATIGDTPDQWEPDGVGGDDYAGTPVQTLKWQDHDDQDQNETFDAIDESPDAAAKAVSELDVLVSDEAILDEESLRELVTDIVREELQGALGERITRNVRKLVRREIHRALTAQELD